MTCRLHAGADFDDAVVSQLGPAPGGSFGQGTLDLRADTLNEMRRIYSTLGIPVEDEELRRAVEKHSWENVPEREKGRGKFYRRGTSGGWKEDLTPRQVEVIEQATAHLLEKFYPEA